MTIAGTESSRSLRLPEFLTALEGGKVVSLTHRPPLPPPQAISLVHISARGYVEPRAIVRSEGLRQWKIANDIIGSRTRDLPACSTRSTSFSILLFWFAL